ncbi:calcineurin-like phosphoesterase family protein [Dysgonomonas hofstadii]|uniref:Calcineurin-like phosphoesterase family protein n=1 Tax=Dysgonomonas hofstadii TaxID=637886 RepID=A0A840CQT4_9BACT|nr:metallophosphoesterase [Dysgonomonas hofstadii]MBB4034922.1 calcineurin-like phosphoesterase family protein [Dysgonomonas hofstadii]
MKKINSPAEKIFFTSDTHFGHDWIINFNNRPYQTKEEMDCALIENWNKVVPADGLTFVLGDIGFTSDKRIVDIFDQLNGEKILIRGNHDDNYTESTLNHIFTEIHDLLYIRVTDNIASKFYYMVLCHYPMLDWQSSFRGTWQLFGHLHTRELEEFETFKTRLFAQQYDVGVDGNDFRPVSFYELRDIMEKQKEDKIFKDSNYY